MFVRTVSAINTADFDKYINNAIDDAAKHNYFCVDIKFSSFFEPCMQEFCYNALLIFKKSYAATYEE